MTPEELFYEYYDYAVAISRKFAKHLYCQYFDTDDAIQCGLIGLMEACNRYKENSDAVFKSFSYVRIIGRIKDNIRQMSSISRNSQEYEISREKLYRQADISYSGVEFVLDYFKFYNPENGIIHKIDNDRLHDYIMTILRKIPYRQQQVLYNVFINGYTQIELGIKLGISASTVATCMFRAKENFRKYSSIHHYCPSLFSKQKEYPMPDDIKNMEKKTETQSSPPVNYEVHVNELWKNRMRPYVVRIKSVDQEIITYERTKTVRKDATRTRVVRIPKKIFCVQFERVPTAFRPIELESKESIPGMTTPSPAEIAPHNPDTSTTTEFKQKPEVSIKMVDVIHPTSVSFSVHRRLLSDISHYSPLQTTEADRIFAHFKSYDMVIIIIDEMINHETWADMNDKDKRILIIDSYINDYEAGVKSNKYSISIDRTDNEYEVPCEEK